MAPFLYRCPNTGQHVQGWIADDPTDLGDNAFETVMCTACTRLHLNSIFWDMFRIKLPDAAKQILG